MTSPAGAAVLALPIDEHGAHLGLARDDRRRFVDRGRANRGRHVVVVDQRAAAEIEFGALRQLGDGAAIVKIEPFVPRQPGDRAIHGAGIDVAIAEPIGNRA
jgi:hypothetical protein